MTMFNISICIITFSLPWFMEQTFQVPIQYGSLQPQILLSPQDTSTTEHCFCVVPEVSFFLELLIIALHSSPVSHWTSINLRGSSSGIMCVCVCIYIYIYIIYLFIYCLFTLSMGFSRQEYWSRLPLGHTLLEYFKCCQ